MESKDIKVGKSYPYRSSKGPGGEGKVTAVVPGAKGHYVTLVDKATSREVKRRPSQVGPA